MRLATLAAIGILTVATAALAQVARTPVEQKSAVGNTAAVPDTAANITMANDMAGNAVTANTTAPDAKTEPAAPPR